MLANPTFPTPFIPGERAAEVRRRHRDFVAALGESTVFQEFRRAFETSLGLPLALRAPGAFAPPLQGSRLANAFCELMAARNSTCAACLSLQARLEAEAQDRPATARCFAGLHESAVPVRMDSILIGHLQTGQALLSPPSDVVIASAVRAVRSVDPTASRTLVRAAFVASPVMSRARYAAALQLVKIFAQQLAELGKVLVARGGCREPPAVARAREFIGVHYPEELSLATVARAAGMSPYYFCKTFHRSTGMTLTEYLNRVRVEAVQRQFRQSECRIGDTAYEAGFRSLSQFNRVFHRLVGERPSVCRERLRRQVETAVRSVPPDSA